MRHLGRFYSTGEVLDEPIVPRITGAQFAKLAVATAIVLFLFRRFGK